MNDQTYVNDHNFLQYWYVLEYSTICTSTVHRQRDSPLQKMPGMARSAKVSRRAWGEEKKRVENERTGRESGLKSPTWSVIINFYH